MSEINAVFGSSYTAVAYMTGDILFDFFNEILQTWMKMGGGQTKTL
jgi:hypothetical protein